MNDDAPDNESPLGPEGCCFPGKCCMPGPHYESECHTPEMMMAQEAIAAPDPQESFWKAHAAQSDRELCQLQDALGCPAELRLVECDRCEWSGTTRDATLPGEFPKEDCMGNLIDGGVADAQECAMERIRDLIAAAAALEQAQEDLDTAMFKAGQWQACAERLALILKAIKEGLPVFPDEAGEMLAEFYHLSKQASSAPALPGAVLSSAPHGQQERST